MHGLVGYWGVVVVTYWWRGLEASVFLYQSTLRTGYKLFSLSSKYTWERYQITIE